MKTNVSKEECAVVCMLVSNPGGIFRKDGDGWQKRANDLIRALRDDLDEAEARADRYENAMRRAFGLSRPADPWRRVLESALAETAQKTSEANVAATVGDVPTVGQNLASPEIATSATRQPGTVSEEPGTSSPDDAERAARKTGHDGVQWAWCEACSEARTKFIAWLQDYYGVDNESCVSMSTEDFKTVIRTRDAQAREAGRVEAVAEVVKYVRAVADARKGESMPRTVFKTLHGAADAIEHKFKRTYLAK